MHSSVCLLLLLIGSIFCSQYERELFNDYMRKFHKAYTTEEEYNMRFQNFKESLLRIHSLNRHQKATFALNKFSDMSKEEFSKTKLSPVKFSGEQLARSCLAKGVTAPHVDPSALPTSFDWREKGVVTPVKDQGQCGSCWAFSTIGNIESQWAIKKHPLTQFSEQMLVDCSHGCSNEPPYGAVCNQGCGGGWQWNAYEDILVWGGVVTETEYPYEGVAGTCSYSKSDIQAKISNYTCLTHPNSSGADEDVMAAFLIKNGPLAIAMDASYLMDYDSGVIDPWFGWECDGTQLDHALLIVGFGVETSEIFGDTPFWIIKNSWNSDWGENGYFRIYRGSGACGINNAVSSVIM